MIKVALVRGKYLNNFEGQNYIFPKNKIDLTAISSLTPLDDAFHFPVIRLPSIADFSQNSILSKLTKVVANRTLGDAQILFGLEKYAKEFDIFHTADSHYYYSYQLAKLRQVKEIRRLISTSWETIPFNNETVGPKKALKKFTQKQVDLFLCYTQKSKDCLILEGIPDNKIKVVRLGVDLTRFAYKVRKPAKKITVLFAGRKVKEKGIDDIHQIFDSIGNKNIELKMVSGIIDYDKMPQVYAQADILLVPSKKTENWEEQYGMVLVEAMATGLPVIAYDSGSIKEVLADAGIIVPEGNIRELANSLKRLSESKDLRLKLGKIGRRRAEKYFDSKKTAQMLIKIYENLNSSPC